MKHYIKSFLLFALVCVGLVSCNEQDMTDNVTYPVKGTLNTWKSATPSQVTGLDFYFINSVDAVGDTICNVIMQDPESKQSELFAYNGRSEYDPVVGMSLNNFSESALQGLPLEIAIALRHDFASANIHISTVQGKETIPFDAFKALPQKGFPLMNLFWANLNDEDAVPVSAYFMPENKFMVSVGDGAMYAGTYDWNEVQGLGVLHMAQADEEGTPLPGAEVKDESLYLNQNNQLVISVAGTEYVLKMIQG